MDKQASVNTNHETISKSVNEVDSHVNNLIFDAPDATPSEIETLNRLNTINNNIANYNPASLKLSQFRILYAMPSDVKNFINAVIMMDKNNELDTNSYNSYGRNAIIARLRDFIRSYNNHIRLVNAGYDITEPTVDDCIKYIFEWDAISWNCFNSIKFEENLNTDDFKFILRLMHMRIMRLQPKPIIGYNAYNVLIGLHRHGWTDEQIEHELGLCLTHESNNPNIMNITIYATIMNGFANNADEYLAIRQHIPSDLNQLPEYVRGSDIIDMIGDTTDRLIKLVSTRANMDFTGIPDSACDYMDFLLRSCMQCAQPVYEIRNKQERNRIPFLDTSYDNYYHGGCIHDALMHFLQHVADDMTISELALALTFVYAFNNTTGNSEYSYVDYVSILDVENRERDSIMRMTNNHIMRAVRDYPTEFIQQLIESIIDYNGLEYYNSTYEEIRTIKDNHIPTQNEI